MPLIFSAITPHSPLLVSTDKANARKVAKTRLALEELNKNLYSAKPDAIIMIAPHGNPNKDVLAINQAPSLIANFSDFGNLETKLELKNNIGLGYQIKQKLETNLPLMLFNEPELHYGFGVPLLFLTNQLRNCGIIPIYTGNPGLEHHLKLGRYIRKICDLTSLRIAVIASGNMSHKDSKEFPDAHFPLGKKYDDAVMLALQNKKAENILSLDQKLIAESGQCGYKVMCVLLAVLGQTNFEADILCFQKVGGIGYLTANLVLI